MQLRRLGEVLHATPNGYLVATIEQPDRIPPLGIQVFDEDRKPVGQLLDVIGPVKQPYAVIKPASRELLRSIKPGTVLFYQPPRPARRRRSRRAPRPAKPGKAARRSRQARGGRGGAHESRRR
jgi:RNA-binding protein